MDLASTFDWCKQALRGALQTVVLAHEFKCVAL